MNFSALTLSQRDLVLELIAFIMSQRPLVLLGRMLRTFTIAFGKDSLRKLMRDPMSEHVFPSDPSFLSKYISSMLLLPARIKTLRTDNF